MHTCLSSPGLPCFSSTTAASETSHTVLPVLEVLTRAWNDQLYCHPGRLSIISLLQAASPTLACNLCLYHSSVVLQVNPYLHAYMCSCGAKLGVAPELGLSLTTFRTSTFPGLPSYQHTVRRVDRTLAPPFRTSSALLFPGQP